MRSLRKEKLGKQRPVRKEKQGKVKPAIKKKSLRNEFNLVRGSAKWRKWNYAFRIIRGWTNTDEDVRIKLLALREKNHYPAKHPMSADTIRDIRKAGALTNRSDDDRLSVHNFRKLRKFSEIFV